MKSAEEPLRKVLKTVPIQKPLIRCHFNYDSKEHVSPDKIRFLLAKQVSYPVKWEQTLNELYYDQNLPVEEDYSNITKQPEGQETDFTELDPNNFIDKEVDGQVKKNADSQVTQSGDRIYPDIYECGPAQHTGPVLKTLNHRAYRYYKFIGV